MLWLYLSGCAISVIIDCHSNDSLGNYSSRYPHPYVAPSNINSRLDHMDGKWGINTWNASRSLKSSCTLKPGLWLDVLMPSYDGKHRPSYWRQVTNWNWTLHSKQWLRPLPFSQPGQCSGQTQRPQRRPTQRFRKIVTPQ